MRNVFNIVFSLFLSCALLLVGLPSAPFSASIAEVSDYCAGGGSQYGRKTFSSSQCLFEGAERFTSKDKYKAFYYYASFSPSCFSLCRSGLSCFGFSLDSVSFAYADNVLIDSSDSEELDSDSEELDSDSEELYSDSSDGSISILSNDNDSTVTDILNSTEQILGLIQALFDAGSSGVSFVSAVTDYLTDITADYTDWYNQLFASFLFEANEHLSDIEDRLLTFYVNFAQVPSYLYNIYRSSFIDSSVLNKLFDTDSFLAFVQYLENGDLGLYSNYILYYLLRAVSPHPYNDPNLPFATESLYSLVNYITYYSRSSYIYLEELVRLFDNVNWDGSYYSLIELLYSFFSDNYDSLVSLPSSISSILDVLNEFYKGSTSYFGTFSDELGSILSQLKLLNTVSVVDTLFSVDIFSDLVNRMGELVSDISDTGSYAQYLNSSVDEAVDGLSKKIPFALVVSVVDMLALMSDYYFDSTIGFDIPVSFSGDSVSVVLPFELIDDLHYVTRFCSMFALLFALAWASLSFARRGGE